MLDDTTRPGCLARALVRPGKHRLYAGDEL